MIHQANFAIVTDGDMSADITSSPIPLANGWGVSVQAFYTGSPNGTLELKISNDIGVQNADGTISGLTNWSVYPNSTKAITTSGDFVWDISATAARWFKLVYVFSSGTGVLNARANIKE